MELNLVIMDENKENIDNKNCIICKIGKIEYMCMPCRCQILCKKCAMKMATGGICKICKEMFAEAKRIY